MNEVLEEESAGITIDEAQSKKRKHAHDTALMTENLQNLQRIVHNVAEVDCDTPIHEYQ